jgi:hypothetical protein
MYMYLGGLENVGIFHGHLESFNRHLVYFVVIWYIFHILVCLTKKNLATLQNN